MTFAARSSRSVPCAGAAQSRAAARPLASAIWREQHGQAAVELIALAPVVVAAAMAVFALLAAGRATEIARTAAQAGAMALLQGADAHAAARDVVPDTHRPGLRVLVRGRSVTVHVRPRVPVAAARLAATSTAHAGAAP